MQTDIHIESRSLLEISVARLQLNLSVDQINQLMTWLDMLIKWNAVYNLTSIRNPVEMVKQHLLDSLATVFAFDYANTILDVGSGAGLPGIVLAIVYPDKKITLIDVVNKKTAFLKQVKAELDLKNVTVCTGRVEHLRVDELFDAITSRAFSDLSSFANWAGHLLTPSGAMIALKGKLPQEEIDALDSNWKIKQLQAVNVPELVAQRHLIWLIPKKVI